MFHSAPAMGEVIWSDGPGGEFKNRFAPQILELLVKAHKKTFTWKFSATGHGKGVVDGVGGAVKGIVRTKSLAKIPACRMQIRDVESFVKLAKQHCQATDIFLVTEDDVDSYRRAVGKFSNVRQVPQIKKMHVMCCDGKETRPYIYIYIVVLICSSLIGFF